MIEIPRSLGPLWAQMARRRSQWVMAGAILFIVAEACLLFFLRSRYGELERAVASKTTQIRVAASSGLTQLGSEEVTKMQDRLAKFNSGFVSVAEMPSVLNGISDQAERNDIQVVGIQSLQPEEVMDDSGRPILRGKAPVHRVPIEINLEGKSQAIANFLNFLGQSHGRIFVVDSYRITPSKRTGWVHGEMVLSFFTAA